jgi:hypothetical protein
VLEHLSTVHLQREHVDQNVALGSVRAKCDVIRNLDRHSITSTHSTTPRTRYHAIFTLAAA